MAKDTDRLYVCRWCFRYSCDVDAYVKHTRLCDNRTAPPGTKVYEHGGYSVWEVDGEEHKLFAQNLSLFAKLFLDHKSVFFDVASFLFYLLTFSDPSSPHDQDSHILGYFSKEKMSWDANNLACILVFPPYQHKQLGKLLMGVSYRLSGWDSDGGLIGSPERPLSEMGWKSYSRFWRERVVRYLLLGSHRGDPEAERGRREALPSTTTSSGSSKKRNRVENMTVQDMGLAVGMLTEDVITTLKGMGVVEPDRPRKKRKVPHHLSPEAIAGIEQEGQTVKLRKSNVVQLAKENRITLLDPVREEGFLGKWASQRSDEET